MAVENIETISLVLVSPSQLIALNVVSIFFLSSLCKIFEERSASVKIYPKVVAIFGKIIPDPFAIPYILILIFPISLNWPSAIAIAGFTCAIFFLRL